MPRIWTREFEAAYRWAETWAPHCGVGLSDDERDAETPHRTRRLVIGTIIALGRQGRLGEDVHQRWPEHVRACAEADDPGMHPDRDLIEIINGLGGEG